MIFFRCPKHRHGDKATYVCIAPSEPNPPTPPTSFTSFTDVKPGVYYAEPVNWAVESGITAGTGNGKFSHEKTCTRGQIVTLLYNARNL